MTGFLLVGMGIVLGAYTFFGYPLLLSLGAAVRRGGRGASRDTDAPGDPLPKVSITVPVYNEAHQIEDLLASLVALEYPSERCQILIVSDGSTDGTDELTRRWADRGVELLAVEERGGKGAAENAARPHLTGEIIVNTDASIRIRPDALRHLVAPFSDPTVGVVSGRDVSVTRLDEDQNTGEGGYVGYEMFIRDLETRVGGIVGASGCFYATRRELHEVVVPAELSRDFASALVARDHGFRAVSAPEAVCYVPRTGSLRKEYRRKVRTVARGMTTLWAWRHLLNPIHHPGFAWKLASHKLCRWALPVALVVMVLGAALLFPGHGWARVLVAGFLLGAVLAGAGWVLSARGRALPRLVSVPTFVAMSNVAVLHAFVRSLGRGSERMWEPTRRESAAG